MMRAVNRFLPLVLLGLASSAYAGDYVCKHQAQACLDEMSSKFKSRGWVGIEMDYDEKMETITIKRVVDDSPAKAAGLQPGDVLRMVDGIPLKDESHWSHFIVGATIEYTLERGGVELKVPVKLGQLPPEVMWQWVGQHMLEHHARAVPAGQTAARKTKNRGTAKP